MPPSSSSDGKQVDIDMSAHRAILAAVGLLAIAVAVGALTSWPWGVMLAGVFCVVLALLGTEFSTTTRAQTDAARLLHSVPTDANPPRPLRERTA